MYNAERYNIFDMKKYNNKIISIPPTFFYICFLINIATLFIPNLKKIIIFPVNLSGILIIILGTYLIMSPYYLFKKYNTPEKFKKSSSVIKNGLYKYSRNPMYLGMVIFLLGLSVLIGNVVGFITPIFLFTILNFMFIPYEEERMEKEQGKEYLNYKNKVGRWL